MPTRDPAHYPWPTPLRHGVIGSRGWSEQQWEPGRREGRLPVLAVGSNASPRVLSDKLGTLLGLDADPVYIEVCRVSGLGVGHSAHLSAPGYMAAAPFYQRIAGPSSTITSHPTGGSRNPGGQRGPGEGDPSRAYSLAWLSAAQADALDATEPNYDRLGLPADAVVSSERAPAVIAGVTLYVSHHGVLAEGGQPVSLMSQPAARTWLRQRLQCLLGVVDDDAFARPSVRESVRQELASGGWVAPSGLRPYRQPADR